MPARVGPNHGRVLGHFFQKRFESMLGCSRTRDMVCRQQPFSKTLHRVLCSEAASESDRISQTSKLSSPNPLKPPITTLSCSSPPATPIPFAPSTVSLSLVTPLDQTPLTPSHCSLAVPPTASETAAASCAAAVTMGTRFLRSSTLPMTASRSREATRPKVAALSTAFLTASRFSPSFPFELTFAGFSNADSDSSSMANRADWHVPMV